MNTVKYETYDSDKITFFKKHNFDYSVHTTDFENEGYCKYYIFDDGAEFWEKVNFITEEVEVTAHGITVKAPVKFCKTEYWSTESASKWLYERY